ncbi:hypothetical protein WJ0W_002323 [Paenibacillus melissococcoides]|uniref:Uncharacterized protein n=1 Tax=Paenibacillus melissococcoides TaxID=2912268 RepID=A0ABM9G0H7_9BACL|nr:hypothetical protein WJ0W_002323 [Paenibacillus melissococcoides]
MGRNEANKLEPWREQVPPRLFLIMPLADGQKWMWGSGGIVCLFWCGRCKVSGHLWQCTAGRTLRKCLCPAGCR